MNEKEFEEIKNKYQNKIILLNKELFNNESDILEKFSIYEFIDIRKGTEFYYSSYIEIYLKDINNHIHTIPYLMNDKFIDNMENTFKIVENY